MVKITAQAKSVRSAVVIFAGSLRLLQKGVKVFLVGNFR